MAKSALLYADHVHIYSPTCALIRHISSLGHVPERHATRLALELVYYNGTLPFQDPEDAWRKLEEFILGPDVKRGFTRKSIKIWETQRHWRSVIKNTSEKFRDKCQDWVSSPAFVELREAENAGVLTFNLGLFGEMSAYDYLADFTVQFSTSKRRPGADTRDQKMISAMADLLFDSVMGTSQYPLLDKDSRSLIRTKALAADFTASVAAKQGGKIVGLGDTLVSLLPICDLPMNEILGVRDELRNLSTQFHAALRKASTQIDSLQWEHGFEQEARLIIDTIVSPAVAEIEAAIKQDNTLRKIFSFATDTIKGIAAGGGVWVFLENAFDVASLIAAGVATSAAAATLIDSRLREKQEHSDQIRKNEWFFYYEARRRFESSL